MIKLSYFSTGQYTKGDAEGEVITLNELIDRKLNGKLAYLDKSRLPSIQGQYSGNFMIKKDIISYKYYENWDGLVFADIDSPKYTIIENDRKIDKVSNWWTDEVIKTKLNDYAIKLAKYKWFIGIALSGGGHGWHILGFIKSRWHSETEYIANYIQIYNDVYSELLSLFNEYPKNEVQRMCDGHNIYPYQKFFVSGKTFIINNKFDEIWSSELNDYSCDDEYLLTMKNNSNIFIVNQVMNQFNNNIINKRQINVVDSKIDKIIYSTKYNITKNKPLYDKTVGYFNNVYRFMLVKTLKCFFNKEDALNITLETYDRYWQEGHDKDAAHSHIQQLINNEEPFEVKDWFIDILIKIGILQERPLFDKLYDMDELQVNYLSDIMDDIIKESADITIIDSPVASGKTTSIKKIKDSLWMCEPYNPVIKNNFEGLSDSFQCLYDDIKLDPDKITTYNNKVASSYNKLISTDINIFKEKNIKYLFIDESHTIFSDCDFRYEVMYDLMHKIIDIAKLGVKVFLMSGTVLKEKELFGSCTDLNIKYIKVNRKHKYKKDLIVYTYDTENNKNFVVEDFIARKINEYKDKGYNVLIPTNKGDKKIDKIMARCSAMNGYNVCDDNFNIYKRDYRNEDINKELSIEGNMKNQIMFCTTYLSVGVSINNKDKACIIFFGSEWTAYKIEQYACRFRNTDIIVLWVINQNKCDENTTDFKLIKIPSEEEIQMIIDGAKREIEYRGWENWDVILQRTLNSYPGIIKENMFEMNELYYDQISLYLSWYVYSIKKYYMNFMNNIEELRNRYSFNVEITEVNEKSNTKEYKDDYQMALARISSEQGETIIKWIDYLDDYYFLQGHLEFDFNGVSKYREPYITLHKFAMYCWYNRIKISNIKNILRCCVVEDELILNIKNRTKEYNQCIKKIENAKKSLELGESKDNKDKNKKCQIKKAKEKLEREEEHIKSFYIQSYSIKTSFLDRIKKLIRIMNHYNLDNISRLMKFVKEEVDKVAYDNTLNDNIKLIDIDELIEDIANNYNKICNAPTYINFTKYNYELQKNIKDFIVTLYHVEEKNGIIMKSEWSKTLPSNWFEIDKDRQINNTKIDKNTRFLLQDLKYYK